MAQPEPSLLYCAAAANRSSNVADIGSSGLVAFGSGSLVALWHSEDQNHAGVYRTLAGHAGEVTALKFVKGRAELLVSGDSSGQAIVWKQEGQNWSLLAKLKQHKGSVSALATLNLAANKSLVITAGSDGLVFVSLVSAAGAELVQEFSLGGKIALEMALSFLPASDSLILAIGQTDVKLAIYASSTSNGAINFTKALSLEGHADWIRSLDFTTPIPITSTSSAPSSSTATPDLGYDILPGEILLASGSQDAYIRLWRFTRLPVPSTTTSSTPTPTASSSNAGSAKDGLESLDELERTLASVDDGGELRVKAHDFAVEGEDAQFSCSAEAVLLGHDTWVTGLHWAPPSSTSSLYNPLKLLSASADRSLILWEPESLGQSGSQAIWSNSRRFGEFSSATNLGFFGALWGTGARTVLAHGWGGSWHVWREQGEGEGWEPVVATSGHFAAVKEVVWEPRGRYLLSCGLDMTTRLHAPWTRPTNEGETNTTTTWHELGRPQIHGYQIVSVAWTDRLQFVSAADEKILRVFDAPKVALHSLERLAGVKGLGDAEERPMAAMIPPLGLSNRTIANEQELGAIEADSNDPFDALALPANFEVASHPPFEEGLLGATLWPETEKLYGHAFEIVALAASHTSGVIATSCKATSPEHAVVRFYEVGKGWKPIGSILKGHALTITRVRFSHDDKWIVTVSRDRTWRLWERQGTEGADYAPVGGEKSHARIVWDTCWAQDDSHFVTASRDKTAKVWALLPQATEEGKRWECTATLQFAEAATAVASTQVGDKHLLAVGLENGEIHLFTSEAGGELREWKEWSVLGNEVAHVATVTSLDFEPRKAREEGAIKLASGSEDKSVRVFSLPI